MKRSSVTLCAGLLFTAAAVKLAFPGQSKKAIDTLVVPSAPPSVSLNTQMAPAAEPVTVTINAADYLKQDANLVEADLPAAVEEAVETFLSDQEPFSSMAIPADATYDVVLPEFRYVRPVSARTSSAFGFRVHPL